MQRVGKPNTAPRLLVYGLAVVVLLVVVVAVVMVVSDDSDVPQASPPSTYPPGTITPAGDDEINCGEYTWPIEAQLDDVTDDLFAEKHDCFLGALATGTPAVLVEHRFSVEGTPSRTQVRVVGPNRFDLTHDSTLDSFGSQTIDTLRCTGLEISDSQLDAVECDPSSE